MRGDDAVRVLARPNMTNAERIDLLLKYDADFRFERAVMGDEWMADDTDGLFRRLQACVRRQLIEMGAYVSPPPPAP